MFANSVRVSKFVENRKKVFVVCINNHGNQKTNNQIDMTISFQINKNYFYFSKKKLQKFTNFNAKFNFKFFSNKT